MIEIEKVKCLRRTSFYFRQLQKRYLTTVKDLDHNENEFISSSALNLWQSGDKLDSPILRLSTYYYSWNEQSKALEQEIDYNMLHHNVGYFNLFSNQLSKLWNFINENFQSSLETYVNDDTTVTEYLNSLYSDHPQKITKGKFVRMIQFQSIFLFELFEKLYFKYNNDYVYKFDRSLYERNQNHEYIQLGYGTNNSKAVRILYDRFTEGGYVKMDFEDFQDHFEPHRNPVVKILWNRKNAQFVNLFHGKVVVINGKDTEIKLKLKFSGDEHFLAKHFLTKEGKPLNTNAIRVQIQKTINPGRFHEFEFFRELVSELNSLN